MPEIAKNPCLFSGRKTGTTKRAGIVPALLPVPEMRPYGGRFFLDFFHLKWSLDADL